MASGETYIALGDGSIVSASNPMPMSGTNVFATDVALHDADTATQHLAIDANGRIKGETAEATFNHGQAATGLAGIVALVLALNTARRFVRITNLSIHTVYIGHSNAVAIGTGEGIPALQYRDYPTTSALYVVSSNTGDTVSYAEFTN